MMRCDACGVDFSGSLERCPLCQSDLTGSADPSVFPAQRTYLRPRRLAVEILTFIAGATVLLLLFFGYLFAWPAPIVFSSDVALIVSVLFLNSAILHAPQPIRMLSRYFYVMLAIAMVWFATTRKPMITEFVMPIICLVSLAVDVVLLIALRERAIAQYAKYLVFDIAFGLAALAFIPLGWARWDVLVLVSALVSALLLFGLLVFARRQLWGEFSKQFSA